MRPQLALLAAFLFAAQSGCTLIYGDREPGGSGGNGSGGGNAGNGVGGSGGNASGGNAGNGGGGTCDPQVCQELGATCGQFPDGCGGVVDCGTCAAGSWHSIGNFAYNFVGVAYDSSGLWIADQSGDVLHSTDDANFAAQKVQSSLSTLYADGADVWAGGGDGISYKAGSATSFTILVGSPGFVQSIHGVPGSLYAVTDNLTSRIYHSSDGITWSEVTPTPAPVHLHAVFALSATEVLAAGSAGVIYHSTNGGGSWSKVSVGNTDELYAAWGSGSLMVVAAQGRFFRSTDAGATWKTSVYGGAQYFGLSGTGANDLWAVGDQTTVLHSTDGGATWTPAPDVSGGVALYGVYAGPAKQYAVGDYGAIITRTN